jgi:hypothetical protein
MTKPELGQRVKYARKAYKDKKRRRGLNNSRRVQTRWLVDEDSKPGEALFIGWRTVKDTEFTSYGYREDYDEQMIFLAHHTVWLLVDNARHKHFYAFPEDCEICHNE